MAVESMRVLSDLDFTENLNLAKDVLIPSLIKDGIIDSKKYDEQALCANYVLMVKKKGLFGRIYDKFMNQDDNESYIVVLRTNQNIEKDRS